MIRHVFLSPHLDDVVLSCGGTLAYLKQQKDVEAKVITIFAGIPGDGLPLSPFANTLHQRWGTAQRAYRVRREEDKAALAYVNLAPHWLPFLDCIYRGEPEHGRWYYTSERDLFGAVHPAEATMLPLQIANAIEQAISSVARVKGTILYAPLTIGNHVDHQLVFSAATHLLERGYSLRFYEDYPYIQYFPATLASTQRAREAQLTPGGRWQATRIRLLEDHLESKLSAIAAYRSQLDILFGGEAAMIEQVTAFTQQGKDGHLAETFWERKLNDVNDRKTAYSDHE